MADYKSICAEIELGTKTIAYLEKFFYDNYTNSQMLQLLARTVYEQYTKEQPPIPITKEDFIKLRNIFKIKGYRILDDGRVVEETRGGSRYRNISPLDNDTENEDKPKTFFE